MVLCKGKTPPSSTRKAQALPTNYCTPYQLLCTPLVVPLGSHKITHPDLPTPTMPTSSNATCLVLHNTRRHALFIKS
jgi:hypothetical protein